VEFQRWRSSALAAIEPGAPPARRLTGEVAPRGLPTPAPAALPEPPMPRIPAPYPLQPDADPTAARWWEAALALVLPSAGPFDRYGLELAVPVGWRATGDTEAELALWVPPEDVVAANTVARTIGKLEAALSAEAGRPVRVSVEHRARPASEQAPAEPTAAPATE
jgi:hypothetical protein